MKTIPLTITCEETHTSFCLSVESVTESFGQLRFIRSGKSYSCDCDFFNVQVLPDSSLSFCSVLHLTTYLDLHCEIFGD